MKVTNGEIFNSKAGFEKLLSLPLPAKVSYNIAKMTKEVNEQLKIIDTVRTGLIRKYGKEDKGGAVSITPESKNFVKFIEEFNEILKEEVELKSDKVKIPSDNLKVEASVFLALDPFVELE